MTDAILLAAVPVVSRLLLPDRRARTTDAMTGLDHANFLVDDL